MNKRVSNKIASDVLIMFLLLHNIKFTECMRFLSSNVTNVCITQKKHSHIRSPSLPIPIESNENKGIRNEIYDFIGIECTWVIVYPAAKLCLHFLISF